MKRKPHSPARKLRVDAFPEFIIRFLRKTKLVRCPRRIRGAPFCWQWTGHRDPDGYGQVSYEGRARWAHRVSYAIFKRTIPDGLEIDHKCLNPSCVNPRHLQTKTKSANSAEANRRRAKVDVIDIGEVPF